MAAPKSIAPLNRWASKRRSKQIEKRIKASKNNENSQVKIKK